MFKQEKGITLVSLVITIIVMLILAGVSMSMVMGDGSVLDQATAAVENTELANVRDEISMALAGAQTNYYATFANTSGRSTLKKELEKLKLSEFTSAEQVLVFAKEEGEGLIAYKLKSSQVWYMAEIDIGSSGISLTNVQNAAIYTSVTGADDTKFDDVTEQFTITAPTFDAEGKTTGTFAPGTAISGYTGVALSN